MSLSTVLDTQHQASSIARAPRRPYPNMDTVPAIRPIARPRTRVRVRTVQGIGTVVVAHALAFGAIASAAYLVSALVGQVALERAWEVGIRSASRADTLRRTEAQFKLSLDEMRSPSAVDSWASSHGFVPSQG